MHLKSGRLNSMPPKSQKLMEELAGVEGLEPPTLGLEIRCSIRLSYTPALTNWLRPYHGCGSWSG